MKFSQIPQVLQKQMKFLHFLFYSVLGKYSTFIFDIIVIHKLSKSDFGKYSLILLVANFAFTFGFNWHSSVLLFIGTKEKAKREKFNHTLHAKNIISLIASLVILGIFIFKGKSVTNYVGINLNYHILLYIFSKVFSDYMRQYFFSIQKQNTAQIMVIVSRVVLITLALIFSINLGNLLILMSFTEFLSFIFIYKINKNDILPIETNWKSIKQVFNFSFWQLFGFTGLYIINFGDLAVIKHYLTIEDVAVYNAAYKIFFGVAGLSYAIINFYASEVSTNLNNKNYKQVSEFYRKDRMKILAIIIPGVILLILSSKWIIPILCGKQYGQSAGIFAVLMVGAIFQFASSFYTIYFNTEKKYKILQTVNVSRAVLNILLDILLLKYFGIYGPAIATVIAISSAFLFLFLYSENKIKQYRYLDEKNSIPITKS